MQSSRRTRFSCGVTGRPQELSAHWRNIPAVNRYCLLCAAGIGRQTRVSEIRPSSRGQPESGARPRAILACPSPPNASQDCTACENPICQRVPTRFHQCCAPATATSLQSCLLRWCGCCHELTTTRAYSLNSLTVKTASGSRVRKITKQRTYPVLPGTCWNRSRKV